MRASVPMWGQEAPTEEEGAQGGPMWGLWPPHAERQAQAAPPQPLPPEGARQQGPLLIPGWSGRRRGQQPQRFGPMWGQRQWECPMWGQRRPCGPVWGQPLQGAGGPHR
jgi:hypothetical protein